MGDLALVLVAAALTYLSRAAAVAWLPAAQGATLRFVRRLPAPLFASLALFALVGEDVAVPDASVLVAAVAALMATPKKSLGLTLAAGIAGYVVMVLIT